MGGSSPSPAVIAQPRARYFCIIVEQHHNLVHLVRCQNVFSAYLGVGQEEQCVPCQEREWNCMVQGGWQSVSIINMHYIQEI